jgi:hypothetical protein
MTTTVKPTMDASQRAARDLLNRKVREGIIDRRNANQVIKTGLPFVRTMLATWRRQGTSPQWLTDKFQAKLTEAKAQQEAATGKYAVQSAALAVITAEMYLAIWAGMQEDLGQFTAERRAARELDA